MVDLAKVRERLNLVQVMLEESITDLLDGVSDVEFVQVGYSVFLARKGGGMKNIDYVRELLKIDEYRERSVRLLEEFNRCQEEAQKRIQLMQKELEKWQKESENST